MRYIIVATLVTLVLEALASELAAKDADMDQMVDKLVDSLFNQGLKAQPLQRVGNMKFGKPGNPNIFSGTRYRAGPQYSSRGTRSIHTSQVLTNKLDRLQEKMSKELDDEEAELREARLSYIAKRMNNKGAVVDTRHENANACDFPMPGSDFTAKQRWNHWLNRTYTGGDKTYFAVMAVAHLVTLTLAVPTFSWSAFGAFGVMYIITGMFGITLSYHRNLSHKAFRLPKFLEHFFAYCGVLAIQGDPIEWVSSHRHHHRFCDTENDPHTPYEGLWWSHMGWLFDEHTTLSRVNDRGNAADLEADPFYRFIQKTYGLHVLASYLALYAIGGLPFVVWGGFVRQVWVYHITWLVNSASHVWGYQSWKTGDLSRNNWWVALLAFGEGWHNNHHAFGSSARHGLAWWELDPTWMCIWALEKLGLATHVKLPSESQKEKLMFDKEKDNAEPSDAKPRWAFR